MKAWLRRLFDWAGRVGTDPADSPETLLQKRLTVALCVGTLPLTIGWSLIYLAAGAPAAAAIPAFYSLFTPLNTALFAWTRNLGLYRFTQLLTILVLPFLVMLALGGYRQSSAVILWAALCPLGSLLVEELRKTLLWIVGFVVLLVIGALVEPHLAAPACPTTWSPGSSCSISAPSCWWCSGCSTTSWASATSSRSAPRCCCSTSCRARSRRR